jgi:adenylate cyclase
VTRRARLAAALRRWDAHPRALHAAHRARAWLPGDERYGDPLSVAGDEPSQLLGQRLATLRLQRPSAAREAGFGALQLWQALAEAQGRGHGERELAILFTDLVGFSAWALEAGDERALELLRRVALAVEPAVAARDGIVVKRLGDGHMAVFEQAGDAVAAAGDACAAVARIPLGDGGAQLRAGIHLGTPRRLGGDYFGVDVNVAARVGAAAGPGELLISEAVRERLDGDVALAGRWRLRAKGAPSDLTVYALQPPGA